MIPVWLALNASSGAAGGTTQPIPLGRYCLKEPLTGFTGTGHDIELGNFLMAVEVTKKRGRYAISISNQMPDNPQILDAETNDASILRDGTLAFRFTDGWNNEGRARVYPTGKVVLMMTKKAPMNQIGRNYGTFTVSKGDCSGVEFR
jgi:hypothetical protein